LPIETRLDLKKLQNPIANKTKWHMRRAPIRNAMQSLFEFSIIDKGIARRKKIIIFTIDCRTFFVEKDISNLYWNELFFVWI
jgi:hypothetical protein